MKMKKIMIIMCQLFLFSFIGYPVEDKLPETGRKKKMDLIVNTAEIKAEKDRIVWEPERMVKRSVYESYYFKPEEFKKMMGDTAALKGLYKVTAIILRLEDKIIQPDNPMEQSPEGGFTIRQYQVKILKAIKYDPGE
jgi:hypothetical protein